MEKNDGNMLVKTLISKELQCSACYCNPHSTLIASKSSGETPGFAATSLPTLSKFIAVLGFSPSPQPLYSMTLLSS